MKELTSKYATYRDCMAQEFDGFSRIRNILQETPPLSISGEEGNLLKASTIVGNAFFSRYTRADERKMIKLGMQTDSPEAVEQVVSSLQESVRQWEITGNTPAYLLGRMIVDGLSPYTPAESDVVVRGLSGSPGAFEANNFCSNAQNLFRNFLEFSIKTIRRGQDSTPDFQLILHKGQPIILQKRIGEQTSMNLEDIVVDGIRIPAGSILTVEYNNAEVSTQKTIDVSECSVGFHRLGYYSIPPGELREIAFGTRYKSSLGRRRHVDITMQDFKNKAQSVLKENWMTRLLKRY